MGSEGQLNGGGERNRRNQLPVLGVALGLAASLVFAGPVEAWSKKAKSVKTSKLEIVQANASNEGPLGPEDVVRVRLDYVLSRKDRGGEVEVRAKVWAVNPFTSAYLPVEVVPNEPVAKRKGTVEVLGRLKQAYIDDNVAHPLQLVFVLTESVGDGGFRILARSERLELETQLQRLAWSDPVRMRELVASGEPISVNPSIGITRPVRIKGDDRVTGCFLLTVGADGTVQEVEKVLAMYADASILPMREFRDWRFQPATYEGQPVAATFRYCFNIK